MNAAIHTRWRRLTIPPLATRRFTEALDNAKGGSPFVGIACALSLLAAVRGIAPTSAHTAVASRTTALSTFEL